MFTRFAILLILRQLRRQLQSSHAFVVTDAAYWPRRPEESLLYRVMADELARPSVITDRGLQTACMVACAPLTGKGGPA